MEVGGVPGRGRRYVDDDERRTRVTRRAIHAGAAVGIVLAIMPASRLAVAAGFDPVVEAGRQVTASDVPDRLFIDPQVTVDPQDPNTVVVAATDARNGGCWLYTSRDGGLTFARDGGSILPEGMQYCAQVSGNRYIAPQFSQDGTLYVSVNASSLSQGYPNAPETPVVVRRAGPSTTEEARTVASPQAVHLSSSTAMQDYRYTSLAVDPTDPKRIYVGWQLQTTVPANGQRSGLPPNQTAIASSDDGGVSWSTPLQLAKAANGVSLYGSGVPSIVVGPDGKVFVFAQEVPKPSGPGRPPPGRLVMYSSTDHGAHWTAAIAPDRAGAAFVEPPVAAVDRKSGQLYVAWDQDGLTPATPSTIYLMTSTDSGRTWTAPIHLVDAAARSHSNAYYPGISIAPDGRVDVAWDDFRSDPFHHQSIFTQGMTVAPGGPLERYYDVYATSSSDGGKTWSANYRVSDRTMDVLYGGTYYYRLFGPIGMASTDHALYVTWADSRNSRDIGAAEDAYFTRIELDSSAVGAASSGPNAADALWAGVGAAGMLCLTGLGLLVLSWRRARSSVPPS